MNLRHITSIEDLILKYAGIDINAYQEQGSYSEKETNDFIKYIFKTQKQRSPEENKQLLERGPRIVKFVPGAEPLHMTRDDFDEILSIINSTRIYKDNSSGYSSFRVTTDLLPQFIQDVDNALARMRRQEYMLEDSTIREDEIEKVENGPAVYTQGIDTEYVIEKLTILRSLAEQALEAGGQLYGG